MNTEKKASVLITPKGRLSYPHLLERHADGQFPSDKYETLLLIPKSADISQLVNACEAILKEMFPNVKKLSDLKNPPIKDGDEKGGEYKGHYYIKAKSDNRPKIVSADPRVVIDNPELVYGGQYAKLSLNAYGYKKPGNFGVSFGLLNVQILGGGERFGGGSGEPENQFTNEENTNDVF